MLYQQLWGTSSNTSKPNYVITSGCSRSTTRFPKVWTNLSVTVAQFVCPKCRRAWPDFLAITHIVVCEMIYGLGGCVIGYWKSRQNNRLRCPICRSDIRRFERNFKVDTASEERLLTMCDSLMSYNSWFFRFDVISSLYIYSCSLFRVLWKQLLTS